jgi:hypothetical protein
MRVNLALANAFAFEGHCVSLALAPPPLPRQSY